MKIFPILSHGLTLYSTISFAGQKHFNFIGSCLYFLSEPFAERPCLCLYLEVVSVFFLQQFWSFRSAMEAVDPFRIASRHVKMFNTTSQQGNTN